MYAVNYHRAKSVAEAAKLAKGDAKLLSGGMTLIPAMKTRLAAPSDVIDLTHIKELKGVKVSGKNVTIGAATTHYEVATRREAGQGVPFDLPSGLDDRRSGSAPSRHDRRLDRQQRPGRRLSGRDAGAGRDHHHQQTLDPGRQVLQGPVRDGAEGWRDGDLGQLHGAGEDAATPNSRTRPRATP